MWTTERVDRLRALWAEGVSASKIAGILGGLSRNAVIGKAHRLGLPSRQKGSPPRKPRPPRTKPPSRWSASPPVIQEEEQAPPVIEEPEVEPTRVLLDLRGDECHYPIGEVRPMRYCGRPSLIVAPYCAKHARIMYTSLRPRRL